MLATPDATDPSPEPHTIIIRPARYSELPEIAVVFDAAFWDDEVFGNIIHPHRADYPEDNQLYWLRRARVNWWDWSQRYMVSVVKDGTGRDVITGAALWARIGARPPPGMRLLWVDPRRTLTPLAQLYINVDAKFRPNRAANAGNEDIFERSYHYLDHMWTGKRAESWYLECLDVRPEFQRRGFGKALIKWGFGEAEKENVCVSVISGDGKEEFYRSCGIETKDGWSGMGKNNPLAIAPGGLMFWKDVREENVELDVL